MQTAEIKKNVERLTWLALLVMVGGTLAKANEWDALAIQQTDAYRNISGGILGSIIVLQWWLSIARIIFQSSGNSWDRWVKFHHYLALLLPFATLAHSLQLGYGLLAILPLVLLTASIAGARIDEKSSNNQFLHVHIVCSALTLILTLVHVFMVVMYR